VRARKPHWNAECRTARAPLYPWIRADSWGFGTPGGVGVPMPRGFAGREWRGRAASSATATCFECSHGLATKVRRGLSGPPFQMAAHRLAPVSTGWRTTSSRSRPAPPWRAPCALGHIRAGPLRRARPVLERRARPLRGPFARVPRRHALSTAASTAKWREPDSNRRHHAF